MPRLRSIIGITAVGLALTGCVPAEQYASMKMKADQLAEQLGHSQSEINTANAGKDSAERQLASVNANSQNKDAIIANLQEQNRQLLADNSDWTKKYADQMNKPIDASAPSVLPTKLNNELAEFANQNPDLVEYDAQHGIVKFKSDVTFAPGDATVTGKAKTVLNRFSSILNAAGTNGYELLVAGHTDNIPVSSDLTKHKGHFNNWYLSAHRAIAVGAELQADGVSAKHLGVVGYADERPVATNTTDAGRSANRRVEVMILPMSLGSGNSVAMADDTPMGPRPTKKAKPAPSAPVEKAVPASSAMSGNK